MTGRTKRIGIASCVLLIVGAAWLIMRKPGGITGTLTTLIADSTDAIEQWVGKQLLAIANAHFRPQLNFTRLRFEFPATVFLENVQLKDGESECVRAAIMKIEFRETPKVGKPIVIQTVELTDPVVRLIEQAQGGLAGFSHLLAGHGGEQLPDGGSTRPSDVFVIRRIGIINGTIQYEPLDQPMMYLDRLTFDLRSEPTAGKEVDAAGWYDMDLKLTRTPILEWTVDVRLNIDTAALDVQKSDLHMGLVPQQYEVLPPPLQKVVMEHEITGDFTSRASGLLLLRDFNASDVRIDYSLTNGHIAFGGYQLPVESLNVKTHLRQGEVEFNSLAAKLLGGSLEMDGKIGLVDPQAMSLSIDARDVRIEQALRPVSGGSPEYSGRLSCNGSIAGELSRLQQSFNGNARLQVSEARLINLPIVDGMVRAAGGMLGSDESNDRGSADVKFFGDRAQFSNIEVISKAVAGRGDGTVHYDSTINFRVNAGPLERLEHALGGLGDLLGKVTDKLVWYEVTGTLAQPVYTVRPLGLGWRWSGHVPATAQPIQEVE